MRIDYQEGDTLIIDYEVGDRVIIDDDCIQKMIDSNRSCVHPNYPNNDFIEKCKKFKGLVGKVTHRFLPGYEMTVKFTNLLNEQSFHMKDCWVKSS